MKKDTKKHFKKRIQWFVENKPKMHANRRSIYLDALVEMYEEHIPYSYTKYRGSRKGLMDYINVKFIPKENKIW